MPQVAEEWHSRAACRGLREALFFPPPVAERKDQRRQRERKAKAICEECPVKDLCLAYALRIEETYGIWGGLNEAERRVLSSRRRAAS